MRRLLNVLTVVSLLLCGVVVIVWVSHRAGRFQEPFVWRDRWMVSLDKGFLVMDHSLPEHAPAQAPHVSGWSWPYLAYHRHCWGEREEVTWTGVGLLPILVVTAILPLARLAPVVLRRVRGYPAGYCRRCGYDLSATPDACPECGEATG